MKKSTGILVAITGLSMGIVVGMLLSLIKNGVEIVYYWNSKENVTADPKTEKTSK